MKNNSRSALKICLAAVSAALAGVLAVQCLFWTGVLPKTRVKKPQAEEPAAYAAEGSLSRDGYALEQVVVLSRHNIRSPLSGNGSVLGSITPHEWFAWSSDPQRAFAARRGA